MPDAPVMEKVKASQRLYGAEAVTVSRLQSSWTVSRPGATATWCMAKTQYSLATMPEASPGPLHLSLQSSG